MILTQRSANRPAGIIASVTIDRRGRSEFLLIISRRGIRKSGFGLTTGEFDFVEDKISIPTRPPAPELIISKSLNLNCGNFFQLTTSGNRIIISHGSLSTHENRAVRTRLEIRTRKRSHFFWSENMPTT